MIKGFRNWWAIGFGLRNRRQDFREARRSVTCSDDDFLRQVIPTCSPDEQRIALFLRRIVAACCGVEPHQILPSDTRETLATPMGGDLGYDDVESEFINDLRDATPSREYVQLVVEQWDRGNDQQKFGDWVKLASVEFARNRVYAS